MIYYDRKYALKKILYTWQKRNLELVGVYEFTVSEKKAIKLYKQASQKLFLAVISKCGTHREMVEVCLNKFRRVKVGDCLGRCTLLRHKRDKDFHIVVLDENPETSLKKVSKQGKVELGILIFINMLAIFSLIHLVTNLIYY